jgi:hypothetical protein
MTRPHAVVTPKPCQNRKVAATRDAYYRRGIRVLTVFFAKFRVATLHIGKPYPPHPSRERA